MSMSLHTIDGRLIKIDKGLGALETWVQALMDGIEERVSNAFANQQEIIDKVEDRVDDVEDNVEEMKNIHHKRMEAIDKTVENSERTSRSSRRPSRT